MKKILVIVILAIFLIIIYNLKFLNTKGECVTEKKINEKTLEYKKIVYDKDGSQKIGGNTKLREIFFDEVSQDNKYEIYIHDLNKEIHLKSTDDLLENDFLGFVADKYLKKQYLGKQIYITIRETATQKPVIELKRYQIYPYKNIVPSTYSGTASIVVQFKCKIEKKK